MLFQIMLTHTSENCPARSPEKLKPVQDWWQTFKKTSGVKVIEGSVSSLEHTFYITVEADDFTTLSRALVPVITLGQGHIEPVLPLDQAFPLVASSAFRDEKVAAMKM